MSVEDTRRRLPVLGSLPVPKDRSFTAEDLGPAPRPAVAVWEFTLMCDHQCLHCGPRAGRARPDELTTEEALRLVDELAELGVGEVALIGGEAYLRDDFLLVVRAIREHGMTCEHGHRRLGADAASAARPPRRPGSWSCRSPSTACRHTTTASATSAEAASAPSRRWPTPGPPA